MTPSLPINPTQLGRASLFPIHHIRFEIQNNSPSLSARFSRDRIMIRKTDHDRHRFPVSLLSRPVGAEQRPKEVRTLSEDGGGRRRRHLPEERRKLYPARGCISAPLRHFRHRAPPMTGEGRSCHQGTAKLFGHHRLSWLFVWVGLSLVGTLFSAFRRSVVLPRRNLPVNSEEYATATSQMKASDCGSGNFSNGIKCRLRLTIFGSGSEPHTLGSGCSDTGRSGRPI